MFVYVVTPASTAERGPFRWAIDREDLIVVEQVIEAGSASSSTASWVVTPGGKVRVEQPANAGGSANGAQ